MKLTHAATYALHALAHLARLDAGQLLPARALVPSPDVSERFLAKGLGALARAGVLHSLKGPHGGFQLARPSATITLLEVLEAVDAPLRGDAPQLEDGEPLNARLQAVCERNAALVRRALGKVTLA